jgi:hypothetical protein
VTRYADKSFSVGGYSPEGRATFDRIFGTACRECNGTEVVPASGPGTKAKLVVPCPQCQKGASD